MNKCSREVSKREKNCKRERSVVNKITIIETNSGAETLDQIELIDSSNKLYDNCW